MIKYIGGALFVAAGWLLGNSLYSVYEDRIYILERFRDFILYCESEITFYKTEMDIIIDKFRDRTNKFDEIIFNEKNKNIAVSSETSKLIKNFFCRIRTLDSESQKGYFSEIQIEVNSLIEKATKDLNVKGKMLKRLTPIAAIGIFILTL